MKRRACDAFQAIAALRAQGAVPDRAAVFRGLK